VWNKTGLMHSKPQNHAPPYVHLKLFGKQYSVELPLDAQCKNDVTKHNEQMQKKRVVLRRYIVAVYFLGNQ
jgi:hypothetical protein